MNTYHLKYPNITTLPPAIFHKIVGGAQWNKPLTTEQEEENHDENPPEINNDEMENAQKTPENSQNTPWQEKPINTRGETYNLRPIPNPNYSDTCRF